MYLKFVKEDGTSKTASEEEPLPATVAASPAAFNPARPISQSNALPVTPK